MSSLGNQVLASSAMLLLIRFIQRGIGIVSTLILARLLTPEEFGFVAIIAVVIQFFDVVSAVGSEQYIIQKSDLDDKDLDTAWTINILIKLVLWVALMIAAPFIAQYYDDPDLTLAIRVASLALIINGLLSPGTIILKKNLTYSKILKLSIYQKVISFSIVMAIVFYEPSYWALIMGDLASVAVFTIGSYLIHPYRPSFSVERFGVQFQFSQWIVYRNIFGFIRAQVDTILVTRTFTMAEVGVFHVSKALTWMPAKDIISPAVDPLLSAFSRVKNDLNDLAYKFRLSLCFVIFLVTPLCFYIFLFSKYIVDVFLGDQWTGAYTILAYMTPLLWVLSVSRVYESICVTMNKVKQVFYYNVISTFFLVTCLILFIGNNLETFVLFRTMLSLVMCLVFLLYIASFIDFNLVRTAFLCSPVFASSILAGVATRHAEAFIPGGSLVKLFSTTFVFFACYLLMMVAIYVAKMHDHAEYRSVRDLLASNLVRYRPLARFLGH